MQAVANSQGGDWTASTTRLLFRGREVQGSDSTIEVTACVSYPKQAYRSFLGMWGVDGFTPDEENVCLRFMFGRSRVCWREGWCKR